jgi:hypothetical protein
MRRILLDGGDQGIAFQNESVDALFGFFIIFDHESHIDVASETRFAVYRSSQSPNHGIGHPLRVEHSRKLTEDAS